MKSRNVRLFMSVMVVVILCSLMPFADCATGVKTLVMVHEGFFQNLDYNVFVTPTGEINVELGENWYLVGGDIKQYGTLGLHWTHDKQVEFTEAVLAVHSWEDLEFAIKQNIDDDETILLRSADGSEEQPFNYNQILNAGWNIPPQFKSLPAEPTESSATGKAGDVSGGLVPYPSVQPLQGDAIRVMSYNIRYGCGGMQDDGSIVEDCTSKDKTFFEDNLKKVARIINQASSDIIVIQETKSLTQPAPLPANTRNNFNFLKSQLSAYTGKEFSGDNQAILYKKDRVTFKSSKKIELGGRNAYRSEVQIGGKNYIIYQVHISRPLISDDEKNYQATETQIEALNDALRSDTLARTIVMGDFNADWADTETNRGKELMNPLLSNFGDVTEGVGYTFPTKEYCDYRSALGCFNTNEKIDYILTSHRGVPNSFDYRAYDPTGDSSQVYKEASDHYPVYADVTLPELPVAEEVAEIPTVPGRPAVATTYEPQPQLPQRGADPVSSPGATRRQPRVIQGCVACEQIDNAWEIVRTALGIQPGNNLMRPVWDPEKGEWVEHENYYTTVSHVETPITPSVTGGIPERQAVRATVEDDTQCLIENYGWFAVNSGKILPQLSITPREVQLSSVTLGGMARKVNAAMANALARVAEEILSTGYEIRKWHSCRDPVEEGIAEVPSCGALHRSCLAVDINADWNPHCPNMAEHPMWFGRIPSEQEREKCRRGEIVTNIPPAVVQIFEKNGFFWGGRFGNPDSMHFEYVDTRPACCSRKAGKELQYTMS